MDRSAKSLPGGADHLSRAESRRLEAGIVRLEAWSPWMLVPFQARQLQHSTVLWTNRRWFLERQFDLSRDETRQRIEAWLVDEFAYAIPRAGDSQAAFTNRTRTLQADRYGSSTGRTPHGGSGRVATIGAFQAKGIGVTPLVGSGGDRGHSHGCCSIEEAIREAIYSEVVAAEFPHGAVPVVAILATELSFAEPDPSKRAIVIRPAVLRIAHAERAPLFLESLTGYRNSQPDDASRTRDVIQRWLKHRVIGLPELVSRIAEQVAFGQVHRMFNGGFFSSNLTVDGAIMDYGGMRAMPDWRNARNQDGVAGFGDEMKIVDKMIESLAFYFTKYKPRHSAAPPSGAALRRCAQEAHARAFARECLRIWNVEADATAALDADIVLSMRRYFSCQQRHRVNYEHDVPHPFRWLHDGIGAPAESETLSAISAALHQSFANFPDGDERCWRAWTTADRYLMPRKSLDREALKARIEQLTVTPREVEGFVQASVASGRRHWPKLPSDLTVLAKVSYDGSTALLCDEVATRRQVLWLEGLRIQDRLILFDSELPLARASNIGARVANGCWTARLPASQLANLPWLKLPKMVCEFGTNGNIKTGDGSGAVPLNAR
jgi:hypothetical protein